MTRQMQVRGRTLQPGGTLVHDVFAPEDSPWRAAAEFWLFPFGGDVYFSDMGNEDDWLGFCADVAKKPTDDFAIIESALEYYSEQSDGARAHQALAALDRLCQDYADRNAEMLATVRECNTQGGEMPEMTPEKLRELPGTPTVPSSVLDAFASAWEVASNRLEQWGAEAQDKNHPEIRPMTRLENAYMDLEGKFGQAQSRIEALEKARLLAVSEWSTWKDVLLSNMTEADWRETMDGLRAPSALAEED